MFTALEEQSKYLSQRTSFNTIESILQQIFQDVNNYSECKIPIDESNTINMKLFPIFPPPPDIKSFDVPISTVRLESMIDANWDPTMEKIIPYINGINSIRKIAELADANYYLVKKCIQHLMHYGCIIMIDIFQFSNIYAPTPNLVNLLKNPEMMKECQSYIYHPTTTLRSRFASHGSTSGGPVSMSINSSPLSTATSSSSTFPIQSVGHMPSPTDIFGLYASLNQRQVVRDWFEENKKLLKFIDIRRFLSFGVIKEIIYRVHSYPIVDPNQVRREHPPLSRSNTGVSGDNQHRFNDIIEKHHQNQQEGGISGTNDAHATRAMPSSSYYSTGTFPSNASSRNSISTANPNSLPIGSHNTPSNGKHQQGVAKFDRVVSLETMIENVLQEPRHFDAICTDVRMSKTQVEEILKKEGFFGVING